jgi:ribosomal protein S18 acetylase RimI-like enzyme
MEIRITKVTSAEVSIADAIASYMIEDGDEQPTTEHLQNALKDDRTHLFAAMIGEHVVGYVLAYTFPAFFISGNMAYLYDIETIEAHRRKGIGKLLMKTIFDHLKSLGVLEVWLGTGTENVEAQALYKAMNGEKSEEVFHDFTFRIAPHPKSLS